MLIKVKYPAGHTRESDWLKSEYHCVSCGVPDVWEEQTEGDYYCGPELICVACGSSFTVQGPYAIDPANGYRDAELQVLQAIRNSQREPAPPAGGQDGK